ncbi:MAG: TIGR03557 family F420-dependent LLM class oxidoreductase [Acidimicrobiales bacterium]
MVRYGYTLMSELHGPTELVTAALEAENAGFDFLVISDHYYPWLGEHEHSPFAWSVLGAVASQTSTIGLATMVTCPFIRYHPAVVAQAAATIGVMSGGRFTLGLGAGERLNEHVVGQGWPAVDIRHEMLAESVDLIRALWDGGYVTSRGRYLSVEDARIFDLPVEPPELFLAAGGDEAARLAAASHAGMVATQPDVDLVRSYLNHGGDAGRVWGQQAVSWDHDVDRAVRVAHERFRFGAQGWRVQAELPTPMSFDAATSSVTPEQVSDMVVTGADPDRVASSVRRWTEAGFTHVAMVQVADDQAGFMRAWSDEIRPQLP